MAKKTKKRGVIKVIKKKQVINKKPKNKILKKNKIKKTKLIKKPIKIDKKQVSYQKTYSTAIDRFYEYIIKNKKVPLNKMVKQFKITKKTAEEWSKILQEHGLIDLYYPVFGGPELRCKK